MLQNTQIDTLPEQPDSVKPVIYTGPTVDELSLTIDGIYLNVNLDTASVQRIKNFVVGQLPTMKWNTSGAAPGHPRRWYPKRYTHGFCAYLSDSLQFEPTGSTRFHCATGPRGKHMKNTHLHWNPAKCHSQFVTDLVLAEYLEIAPATILGATISRIDLAIDVPKIRIDEQSFAWPKMRATANRYSNGRTMYLGALEGATRIAIYDKRAEIKKSNTSLGKFYAPLHEPVPPHELMRVEIRLNRLSVPLAQLSILKNPFVNLKVQVRPKPFSRLESSRFDLALHEGQARATSIFTPAEKKAYWLKLEKAGSPSWWNPVQVWGKQFPTRVGDFLVPFQYSQFVPVPSCPTNNPAAAFGGNFN